MKTRLSAITIGEVAWVVIAVVLVFAYFNGWDN